MNDDYRQGYRDGYQDGRAAANQEKVAAAPSDPTVCSMCGRDMRASLTNFYVCMHPICPYKASTVDTGARLLTEKI